MEVQQWTWDDNNLIAKEVTHHMGAERRLKVVVDGWHRDSN